MATCLSAPPRCASVLQLADGGMLREYLLAFGAASRSFDEAPLPVDD